MAHTPISPSLSPVARKTSATAQGYRDRGAPAYVTSLPCAEWPLRSTVTGCLLPQMLQWLPLALKINTWLLAIAKLLNGQDGSFALSPSSFRQLLSGRFQIHSHLRLGALRSLPRSTPNFSFLDPSCLTQSPSKSTDLVPAPTQPSHLWVWAFVPWQSPEVILLIMFICVLGTLQPRESTPQSWALIPW